MTWITRAVVIAPIFHFALCYYYLFLRNFGFGSNLSDFIAAGDVLTVGLSKLLATYLLFVGSFIFAHLWMDADPLKLVGRTQFNRHPDLERPTTKFLFESLPYIAALGLVVSIALNREVPLVIAVMLLIPLIANSILAVFSRNVLPEIWKVPTVMLIIGLLHLSASAYSEGFRFRHKPPSYFAGSYAKCTNGILVLFSIGDRFVGVTPAGQRVLTTRECSRILGFPTLKVILDVM